MIGEAGAEDDVLGQSAAGLFRDQVLDEAGAGPDGGAEGTREPSVHVAAAAPVLAGGQ